MLLKVTIAALVLLNFWPVGPTHRKEIIGKEVLYLSSDLKLRHITEVPFNHVVVFDNRFDTTSLKFEQNGKYPPKILIFNAPAAETLAHYLYNGVGRLQRGDQTLYIDLRELRFGNIADEYLFIAADAYLSKKNGGLSRVCSFKKNVVVPNSGWNSNYDERALADAMSSLVEAVCAGEALPDTATRSSSDLHTNVTKSWAVYPAVHQQQSADGFYMTFDDFAHNRVQPAQINLIPDKEDSLYKLPPGVRNRAWGVCYKGHPYIGMADPASLNYRKVLFLPLHLKGNTFIFHIPNSLPDMYAMLSSRQIMEYMTRMDNIDNEDYTRKPDKEELGDRVTRIQKDGIESRDFRDCFLDMDTGDVIYWQP